MKFSVMMILMMVSGLLQAQQMGPALSRSQDELPLGWGNPRTAGAGPGENFFDDGGFFDGNKRDGEQSNRPNDPAPNPPEPQRPQPSTRDLTQIVQGVPDGTIIPPQDGQFEREVLRLTNIQRQNNGQAPLAWDDSLANAARYHAADMAVTDYFDHNSFDKNGSQLVQVADTWTRIRAFAQGAGAENIAAGYSTAQALVTGWMNSPGHRANILNGGLKRLGVGIYNYQGQGYGVYGVQNFGY